MNVRMCIVYVLHYLRKTHHSNDGIAANFEIGQDHPMLFLSSYSLLHNRSFWCTKRSCVNCRPYIMTKMSLTVNWRFRRIFLVHVPTSPRQRKVADKVWPVPDAVIFPMVSLEVFIDIFLPAALWPWGWLSLQQKWVPGIFPWGIGGRCIGLTTLPPTCADYL
jgi:hypothetical protein